MIEMIRKCLGGETGIRKGLKNTYFQKVVSVVSSIISTSLQDFAKKNQVIFSVVFSTLQPKVTTKTTTEGDGNPYSN